MFRAAVLVANSLVALGAAACALSHVLSLIGLAPGLSARLFSSAIFVTFPLGGLAIFLSLRVGRTYGVRVGIAAFIAQRAPTWLRRVGNGAFVYALIHLIAAGVIGAQDSIGPTHVPLVASAFLAWFHVMWVEVFTVWLREPKPVESIASPAERASRPLGRKTSTLDSSVHDWSAA